MVSKIAMFSVLIESLIREMDIKQILTQIINLRKDVQSSMLNTGKLC